MTPQQEIQITTGRLCSEPGASFFAHLALKRGVIYDPRVPTAQTEGTYIEVGDWFVSLPLQQRLFVLTHELVHMALKHPARGAYYLNRGLGPDNKPFDRELWGIASDYITNSIVFDIDIGESPPNTLYQSFYNHNTHSVEEVYLDLKQDNHTTHDKGWSRHDYSSVDEEGEAELTESIHSALIAAKHTGNIPCTLQRLFKDILDPQMDWRVALRDILQSHINKKDEATWRRISRRSLVLPPQIPQAGKQGVGADHLLVTLDTSGSIDEAALTIFISEINSLLEVLAPGELSLITWDTSVYPVPIEDKECLPLDIELTGGGGTDYHPVLSYIAGLPVLPDVIITLTDGVLYWPLEPSNIETHIVVIHGGKKNLPPPSWGHVLYMGDT